MWRLDRVRPNGRGCADAAAHYLKRMFSLHSGLSRRPPHADGQSAPCTVSVEVQGAQGCSAIGPATALKVMVLPDGWTWHADGSCTRPGNHRLHVATASSADIARVVTAAWTYQVRSLVAHCQGLANAGVAAHLQAGRVFCA